MESDFISERDHLLRSPCTGKPAGDLGRIRQCKARREVFFELDLGRLDVTIRVGELLSEAKRDFAGSSQGVILSCRPNRPELR